VDRQAVAAQIRQMVRQLGTEMNVTYAGRYTFSGFRTNEPPVLVQDTANRYQITQNFTVNDIEKTKSYQKLTAGAVAGTDPPLVYNTAILKLPYSDAAIPEITSSIPGIPSFRVETDADAAAAGYNPYDSASIPSGTIVYIGGTGELVMNEADAARLASGALTVTYEKDNFNAGELNPVVYFDCIDMVTSKHYNMNLQDMAYEFSVNTRVNINSLAKNVYTDKMYADLNRLCDFVEGVTLSDTGQLTVKYSNPPYGLSGDSLTQAVNRQAADERAQLSYVLHDRFNNMLDKCDRHIADISREQTDLGARMNRLELISTRLDQDEGSYKKLMSDNEDTDMMEAIMNKSNAEAVYQASLKAGASIIQMTLSNFI